mmetsp:Transcript_14516/g.31081  ORF Transcript_14516/g.31081 Transcript_14516/m.31081 type:complete len:202 (+) Transcript_14516:85-690(+)
MTVRCRTWCVASYVRNLNALSAVMSTAPPAGVCMLGGATAMAVGMAAPRPTSVYRARRTPAPTEELARSYSTRTPSSPTLHSCVAAPRPSNASPVISPVWEPCLPMNSHLSFKRPWPYVTSATMPLSSAMAIVRQSAETASFTHAEVEKRKACLSARVLGSTMRSVPLVQPTTSTMPSHAYSRCPTRSFSNSRVVTSCFVL